jgi:hypothetical protein
MLVDCGIEVCGLGDGVVKMVRGRAVTASGFEIRGRHAAERHEERRPHHEKGRAPLAPQTTAATCSTESD